ncbi:response regulator transcription factor [Enterococcus hulanensis]|uniref:Response regulator transcription factor n=1 Tax=Enterococcus hulanensis TaxID=2559929 RepID=A0ABU3F414_9ENTE|nr:response regulator transcription factor [Enterococcus hulanensis]MDT2601248.1 response regulator transcription factor [Enterococcus hulanensis]MDT2610842.1 response regulator transcription factor [Enterococcus hulanensis]MDT2618247.1 response regulator transcription factor [Enterococcus hulanensis]MDT2629183.1 response regulator transcription factor [Enterococcus hulanensis]MDT2656812.1 response regulator transcription factor [Enterococcus hulanensis]
MKKKIILIEDDENLRRGISFYLEQEDYEVFVNGGVKGALGLIQETSPDLIILDVTLPDGNGFELCREIRQVSTVPIFFLTAHDLESDILTGLSIGGDDYLTKPFSLAILKAKVALLFKKQEDRTKKIVLQPFVLNLDSHRLFKNDVEIPLSTTEFRLINYLMKNAGIVLEKELLLEALWDDQGKFVDENVLSVNIRRIRLKIEADPKNPQYIETIRGIGYLWKRGE